MRDFQIFPAPTLAILAQDLETAHRTGELCIREWGMGRWFETCESGIEES
jgi:hypothetical protein